MNIILYGVLGVSSDTLHILATRVAQEFKQYSLTYDIKCLVKTPLVFVCPDLKLKGVSVATLKPQILRNTGNPAESVLIVDNDIEKELMVIKRLLVRRTNTHVEVVGPPYFWEPF